ncbi:hypothetical protein H2201_005123 [Coniosporium apollinis]|uniref:Mei2-like C-terminal RNA recognition motif domain-containing protein n=1 Tax=Coniosporium apollinis TaxID=61459 RepID=A0ABQ9NS67_9PEZI|nr:hypothetical protein H2201_005123 [Coniosporium apollinis]
MRRDEFKGLLDEKVRGLYDFMYFRMDFDNNSKVGYAFIVSCDLRTLCPSTPRRPDWGYRGSARRL